MTRNEARAANTHRMSSPKSLRRVIEGLIGTPGATSKDIEQAKLLSERAKLLDAIRASSKNTSY